MKLDALLTAIQAESAGLAAALKTGRIPVDFPAALGLRRAARLPVVTALYQSLQTPLLLLTDRMDHSLTLLDELGLWLPDAPRLLFPEPNPLFYENAPWGLATRRDRLAVLTALASYHIPGAVTPVQPPVIVAPIRALMTRTLPRREFLKSTRLLKLGQVVQPEELARLWMQLGYERENTVVMPGQFARRGGLLDIWPPAEVQPIRVEFFGDEIENLRRFDPGTQRTVAVLEKLQVTPAREFMLQDDAQVQALPLQIAPTDLSVHEFYIPYFHASPSSLLDYLPRQAVLLVDDYEAARGTALEVEEQSIGFRSEAVRDGLLPADFPIPYLSWSELVDAMPAGRSLGLGGLIGADGTEALSEPAELAMRFQPEPRFGGRLKPWLDHLNSLTSQHQTVMIVTRQTARLHELWAEQADPDLVKEWHPEFIEGSLGEGWSFNPRTGPALHLLTDGEIFGWRRPEPRQRHRPVAEAPESAYADLQVGDWVVHIDHGIGKFIDLVRRTVDGVEREYLCIEYADGDQLFVPVYQADRLTRYVGADGREPSPTRLGSTEWRTVKAHVKEAVVEVAEELLELYAKRQLVEGTTFSPDAPWQQELEASFPYVETEDQLRVIAEVKRDMERPRPMDRLICGDVGYGKTEVALRAAFKAVMDGKQVAILVPTTVLAQQHYNTFRERLAAFPAEVEMLSRFRTPQQQKEILQRLSQGKIDIIIGTHRLIQGDVAFKDLGLLIIDEEQRFGVSHKETLKQMRTEVDVLTLTATPIPRTLYMALTGVRDISTINTPPEERLPIITHVGPFSPRVVRQAILREIERGGQIFFVHNRVQTIGGMRAYLEKLTPEARIAVAHGQMNEQELSQRMEAFSDGQVDILLCTSIIESGLDIPNANTLIVDRADTFGLAQLYQLRGRVGRGAQRAYAYFFRHNRRQPTLEGRERLETIAENTQLGAGYSIAMRDLEIRGMGDILGMRQHGHVAAVGFHLYTRLLADAVRRLRQARPNEPEQAELPETKAMQMALSLPVNVDLPLRVGLPLEYVPERDARLRLYRRIANVSKQSELEALASEFTDRFGPLPEETHNLFYQVKVRLMADAAGVSAISLENNQVVLRFPPLPEAVSARPFPYLGSNVRSGKNSLWLPVAGQEEWREQLVEILKALVELKYEVRGQV